MREGESERGKVGGKDGRRGSESEEGWDGRMGRGRKGYRDGVKHGMCV